MKIRFFAFILLFSLNLMAQTTNAERLQSISELKRFALGSCNDSYLNQVLWPVIQKESPELFIWGGDNVYADTTDPTRIRELYDLQNSHENYAQFKKYVPIIGTWDDHDFGHDNSNGTFLAKRDSQKHALDFLEEPINSPRRTQEGIYTSYEFGQVGRKVKIILLDNRYFMDLDSKAPLLGEAQWQWLENEFKNSDASVHFIVSGLTVLSPYMKYGEEWADYPQEQERLLDLAKTYNVKGLVFLTGDKHTSSIFKRYGHLEFMSSGLNRLVGPRSWRWYIGRFYYYLFYGQNFGLVDIAWDGETPLLTLTIKGNSGQSVYVKNYKIDDNNSWQEL